jgi:hypothetical protein
MPCACDHATIKQQLKKTANKFPSDKTPHLNLLLPNEVSKMAALPQSSDARMRCASELSALLALGDAGGGATAGTTAAVNASGAANRFTVCALVTY